MRNIKNQLTNSKEKKNQIVTMMKVSFDFQQWLIRNCIVFVNSAQVLCSCVVYASQKKLYLFLAAKLEIFTVLPGLTTSLDNLKKSRLLPDETDDAWWSSERTSKWICYNWQVRCIFQSFFISWISRDLKKWSVFFSRCSFSHV